MQIQSVVTARDGNCVISAVLAAIEQVLRKHGLANKLPKYLQTKQLEDTVTVTQRASALLRGSLADALDHTLSCTPYMEGSCVWSGKRLLFPARLF